MRSIARILLAAAVIAACPWTLAPLATAQSITLPGAPPDASTSRVDVEAPAPQVWVVLTDFSAYPIWNPFIYPMKGTPRPGSTLEMTVHHGTGSIPYQAIVLAARPNHELAVRVASGEIIEITFDFTIEALRAGRSRLIARESHTGVAVVLSWGLLRDLQSGLDAMAKAARDRAELLQLVPFGIPTLRYTSRAPRRRPGTSRADRP